MSKMVEIPHIFYGSEVLDPIVEALVRQKALPYDYYFRLLQLDDSDFESYSAPPKRSTRETVAIHDVMAALGMNDYSVESKSYLEGELPGCISLPYNTTRRSIVAQLEEYYAIYPDMSVSANKLGKPRYLARQAWERCVSSINPSFYNLLVVEEFDPANSVNKNRCRINNALGQVAVRGDLLLEGYNDDRIRALLGPSRLEILHYALLDNYPEIGPDLT